MTAPLLDQLQSLQARLEAHLDRWRDFTGDAYVVEVEQPGETDPEVFVVVRVPQKGEAPQ
jgi:hypothetical protein